MASSICSAAAAGVERSGTSSQARASRTWASPWRPCQCSTAAHRVVSSTRRATESGGSSSSASSSVAAAALELAHRAQRRGQPHPHRHLPVGVAAGQQPQRGLEPARRRLRRARGGGAAGFEQELDRRLVALPGRAAPRGGPARSPGRRAPRAPRRRAPCAARRQPPRTESYTARRTSGWRNAKRRGTWVGRTRSASSRSSSASSASSVEMSPTAAATSGSNGSPATAAASSRRRAPSGSAASSSAIAPATAAGTPWLPPASSRAGLSTPPSAARPSCSR